MEVINEGINEVVNEGLKQRLQSFSPTKREEALLRPENGLFSMHKTLQDDQGLIDVKCGVTPKGKSDTVGGNMNIVSMEEDKRGVKNYRDYLRRQAELKKLDIEFNCAATIEKIRETDPDVVVVATGAYLLIPNIPGFRDNDKVYTIKSLYEEADLKLTGLA